MVLAYHLLPWVASCSPVMHHTWLCIMPCSCDGCLLCCLLLPVLLLRVSPITSRLWGSVRLRLFVFFMDSFFFLAGFQARWPYPRNHFYLCLLVVRSSAMLRYLPLAISCLPYCHVKPLTHLVLANHCLAMLPLCSAPLIALLVAGEVEDSSMTDRILVGISHYLLFN